jgi:hypothetical protein
MQTLHIGKTMNKLTVFVYFIFFISFGHAEHWPTGYYQTVADPTSIYYYDDDYRWYCDVQNPTQAQLFDVASQVMIVGDVSGFIDNAVSLAECPWPNGFYTISNGDGTIFRLYPGNICTITSSEMLAAYGGTDSVISAEPNSLFGASRTEIGECFWPTWDSSKEK